MPIAKFIVLIERHVLRRALALLTAVATALGPVAAPYATAAPVNVPASKIARDLQDAINAPVKTEAKWARDLNGQRHVQAVVVTDGIDPTMAGVRNFVLGTGGSVHATYPFMHALSVQLNAGQVQALAQRKDVLSITPNRVTSRTASTLEAVTGALGSNVRPNSTRTSYGGWDGRGIGIAILDSGVMKMHEALMPSLKSSRVQRNVQMLSTTQANWTTGVDSVVSLQPGSTALSQYESSVANDNNASHDPYGHGTHVASVAAGRSLLYSSGTPDTTGIAPGASIYDVKVLGDNGQGTLSTAIEGIQWVIYHAKEYNIRVLNVSLAANSTQSWQTDPLCIAVRSATAAGITVVVAAGN